MVLGGKNTRFQYPKEAIEYFREQGRNGGKTAARRMTKAQRSERARVAGLASGKARQKKAKTQKER